MSLKIVRFELRYQMRNPVFWVAAALFVLLVFGMTASGASTGVGFNVHKNAPYAIARFYLIISIFYMFVSAAFVANVVVRDDETGFGPMIWTTRISKTQYLFGRYAGAFLAAALGFLAIPLALWFGTLMPWIDPGRLGPNSLSAYVAPYFYLAFPNLFLTSALLFSLAAMTRSMLATYVGVIGLLVLWTAATVTLTPANHVFGAYVEPFGFSATSYLTRYWTPVELNSLSVPIYGLLFWNRIIWIAIGAAFLGLAHARFRFEMRPPRAARRRTALPLAPPAMHTPASRAPMAEPRFGRATTWAQLAARTRLDLAQVLRSPAYAVLLLLGILNALVGLSDLAANVGTPTRPVTRVMIDLLNGSFKIIPLVIAIYYSSELVWRERDRNVHEIIGASAMPDWAYVLPKTLALALVLLSTLLVGMMAAMAMQLAHTYTHFELGKYLLWYLLPNAVDYTLIAALAVFVQAISPHKFVGWGIMLLFIVSRSVLPQFGLDDHLYSYAQGPEVPLSDMNGQGQFWIGAWSFRAYWAAFALLLLVLSHALWRRGAETRLLPRLKRLPRRLKGHTGAVAAVAIISFVGLGAWCFVNTHVWNEYRTPLDEERYQAAYEQQFLPYEKMPQPAVTNVRVKVDLWPHLHKIVATGTYSLVNHQKVALSEVLVRMRSRDTRWTALAVSGATIAKDYPGFQYRIYRFAKPLTPGAAAEITFTTVEHQIGFRNSGNDLRVVDNGTFVDSAQLLPAIGMDRLNLLKEPVARRKYSLPAELRPAKLEDMSATKLDQFHSDWVKTDITLTTDADQTPVAPGANVADSTTDGRRTARFVTDVPIQNYFSIQSARYQERRVRHGGVDLAVYYDAQHSGNVDRMLAALAHSMDVYRSAFGPYQFREVRIVEFPSLGGGAQSFAGTIPWSEGLGFIADLSEKTKIDYVGYVAAHELAHQWWGNQVLGADVQGATMLTETLAQYSALLAMEKREGPDKMRRYLQYELDKYLRSRGGEAIEELPLARVENQPYIHYNKGSLAMFRLKEELGEDRVNAALRRYLERFRFESAPYPRSLDLIAEFRNDASPVENQLITDLFEKITFYNIRTRAASVRRMLDGRYETTLTVEAHKYYADGKGTETEVPLAERIDYGLFTLMPGQSPFEVKNVLALQHLPVRSGVQQVRLVTPARPSYAGADPYNILVDRIPDDNVITTSG